MAALRNLSALRPRPFTPHARTSSLGSLRLPARSLATAKAPPSLFASLDTFADRHIGPDDNEVAHMLTKLGYDSMDAFVADTVPEKIRSSSTAVSNESIPSLTESQLFLRAKELGKANKPYKSYIGMGYHNAVVPPVILRNVRRVLLFSSCVSEVTGRPDYGKPGLVHAVHAVPA